MDKQQAKHILKNTGYIGNEVGVAFEVAIKSMDKLEKIEQVVDNYLSDNKDVYYDTEVYMDNIIDIVRD